MGLTMLATAALVVFLAVYAHGTAPEPAEDCEESSTD
jgi:hypothetical protein